MISDLIYMGLLSFGGLKDLRSRTVKHWQIFAFGMFICLQLLWFKHLSIPILLQFVLVILITSVSFLHQMIGAADVKIIVLSSLYNFYRFNLWWVWQVGILAGIIDLGLWSTYYRHRGQSSPLIFSWSLANLLYYVWISII